MLTAVHGAINTQEYLDTGPYSRKERQTIKDVNSRLLRIPQRLYMAALAYWPLCGEGIWELCQDSIHPFTL